MASSTLQILVTIISLHFWMHWTSQSQKQVDVIFLRACYFHKIKFKMAPRSLYIKIQFCRTFKFDGSFERYLQADCGHLQKKIYMFTAKQIGCEEERTDSGGGPAPPAITGIDDAILKLHPKDSTFHGLPLSVDSLVIVHGKCPDNKPIGLTSDCIHLLIAWEWYWYYIPVLMGFFSS